VIEEAVVDITIEEEVAEVDIKVIDIRIMRKVNKKCKGNTVRRVSRVILHCQEEIALKKVGRL
jgi:hypothetical protein